MTNTWLLFTAYWTLISPLTLSCVGDRPRVALDDFDDRRRKRRRRNHARAVARVHASLFDVFHDAADHDFSGRVAQRVDVNLGRILQESIDQDWALGR